MKKFELIYNELKQKIATRKNRQKNKKLKRKKNLKLNLLAKNQGF